MKKLRAVYYGTAGDDYFLPVHGDDFVYAGDGNDVIEDSGRSYDDDFYSGQGGDDFIFTNGGNDDIKGGTGNDSVESHNFQNFTFDGGFGNDSIDIQVLIGTSMEITYPATDKILIKIHDNATDDVIQKIALFDVENITWYSIG